MKTQCHNKKHTYKYNKELVLLIGNIASGKSTYTKKYEKTHVILSRDKLRFLLGNGKYIFDEKLEPSVHMAEMSLLAGLLQTDINIVIDETNVTSHIRGVYIDMASDYGYKIIGICLPRLSKEESIKRRMQDPRGYSKKDWSKVWDMFNKRYEEPISTEGFNKLYIFSIR